MKRFKVHLNTFIYTDVLFIFLTCTGIYSVYNNNYYILIIIIIKLTSDALVATELRLGDIGADVDCRGLAVPAPEKLELRIVLIMADVRPVIDELRFKLVLLNNPFD